MAPGTTESNDNWFQQKVIEGVPEDVRTALSHFEIEPILIRYVSCTKYCAIYPLNDQGTVYHEYEDVESDLEDDANSPGRPENCQYRETPASDMCGTPLFRA
jgi:hypothetical protein